jgi:hypothetical protein
MNEIIAYAACLAIGWYGREVYARILLRILNKKLKQLEAEMAEKVMVDIEQRGESYFIYRSDDGTFLAQGKDVESAVTTLGERYPDTTFLATYESVKKLGYPHDTV